jgi:hypothetical protein
MSGGYTTSSSLVDPSWWPKVRDALACARARC